MNIWIYLLCFVPFYFTKIIKINHKNIVKTEKKNWWYVYIGLPTQDETVKLTEINKTWEFC